MKDNHWAIDKLDQNAYNRHRKIEQKEDIETLKDKQDGRQYDGAAVLPQAVGEEAAELVDQRQEIYYSKFQDVESEIMQTNDRLKPPQYEAIIEDDRNNNSSDTNNNDEDDDESSVDIETEEIDLEALRILEKKLAESRNNHHHHNQNNNYNSKVHRRSLTRAKRAKQSNKKKPEENDVNLSFCGCGFLGIYHVGVTSCFHEYAPQLSQQKISGSSAGALVAVSHICGNLSLAYCTTDILTVAIEARSHTLGPFHPSFDVQASVREALERGLPEDAYLKANGKLHVSLTRVEDGANVIINEFLSNEDLIQVLLCSCFIPFWSGLRLPKYKGVAYIDGGFSNNLIILDSKTKTVSPFAGEADICPQDDTLNLLQVNLSNTSFSISSSNLYRLAHALLPPAPEVLSELFEQGFADGIRFLQKMKLISCNKCLEIRSSLLVTTNGEDMEDVITMSGSTQELNESLRHGAPSETSSVHHIVLEQQEQKMIEISSMPSRRSSFVSTTSHQHSADAKAYKMHNLLSTTTTTTNCELDSLMTTLDDEELDCDECQRMRQKALYGPMPKQFRDRIREACDTVNKSLYNWIYSHRPVKYFSYLMVPYYLPIDITLAVIYNCWKRLPTIRSELLECIYQVVNFTISVLKPMQSRSTSAILMGTGGSSWDDDVVAYEKSLLKHQVAAGSTQVHHHHHHHHHHIGPSPLPPNTSPTVNISQQAPAAAINPANKQRSKSTTTNAHHMMHHQASNASQPRELHSLEDTFDNIVDVTSKQEARIFAYYFRDAKNRLQVTEIFDLQRAAELSNNGSQNMNTTSNNSL